MKTNNKKAELQETVLSHFTSLLIHTSLLRDDPKPQKILTHTNTHLQKKLYAKIWHTKHVSSKNQPFNLTKLHKPD